MSTNIDKLFDMLSWDSDEDTQKRGIIEASKINHLSIFIQPRGKDLWDNCALIIVEKEDEILRTYLYKLFEWIADQNWPGAVTIYERLMKMRISPEFTNAFTCVVKNAFLLKKYSWLNNLASFLDVNELKIKLDEETLNLLNQYYVGPMSY